MYINTETEKCEKHMHVKYHCYAVWQKIKNFQKMIYEVE